MKTTRLFSVLMAICLSLGVYAVDWSSIGWVDASDNKYKVEAVEGLGVVNVQQPPWATERGIYVTVPAGISNVSVASSIDGAGAVLHLSAFTAQETKVTITHGTGTIDFLVYYADGTAGGGGEETPEPAVNLALNKPATAGANAEGGAVAVNDGNFGSRWASGAGAHHVGQAKPSDQIVTEEQSQDWCYVDLGAEVAIDSVRFLFEGAAPIHFKVFTSNDAETWTLQVENTENPKTGNTAEFYNVYPFATAVTARYVKFLGLTAVNFEWGIKIYEMEVFSGAENVALNKTAKAGNNEGAVADAIDGDPASLWVSEPSALHYGKPILAGTYTEEEAQDWIYVDLAGIYNLDSVRFLFEGACPTDFDILTSNDAIAWTKQLNITDAPKIGNNAESYNTYAFPSPVEARYVKIFARKAVQANFDYGISIWEFEVYGSAVADTEKPVLTSATLESVTYAEAKIKIVATDNLAVTQCQVTDATNGIDGKYPVDGDILTISGLTPSTTYNFTIQALDGAGNASEATKEVSATTTAHYYEPNVAAPVPTVAASLVKAIYSDTYGATTLGFEDWGGGYAAADKVIDSDNYKMLNTTAGSYLGLVFAGVNATGMKYWHLDIWAENDGTIRIFPIWGGAEYNQTVTLKGQQWNSIELVLATDYPSIDNWSNIYQIKFDNTSGNNLAVDNIYFYTDPIEDEEKPTNVTAVLASASYTSAVLTCQAEDNSGSVSFDVYNGDTKVASGGGESGKPVAVTVSNLASGQAYTLAVEAYDQNGNKADRVSVSASTVAFPASAAAPTAEEANVYAIYSDAYATIHGPSEYNQTWWQNPTVQYLKLTETDNVLLYTSNGNVDGCFGWPFSATFDLTGYTILHYDIYPEATGTVEFGITRRPEGTADVKKVFNVTGGQWNHIELDLTDQDLTQVFQLGFWAFSTVKSFILDNVYFEKPAPVGLKGTYTVGGEGADYASLAEATAAVNALPIEGDVTLLIAADLTETTNSGLVNPTDYTVTIRPATAEMRTITFTATADNAGPSGSIVIGSSNPVAGANEVATKNVVIDGFAEGSDVQNLTIVHKNVAGRLVTYGAASDIIIQNIISRHDDASSGTRYGVQFRGNTGKPENITVRGNYFDGKHTTQVINFSNGISANIENNTFKLSGLASGQLAYGVHGYTVMGTVNVRGNKFIDVTTADVPTNGIVAVSVQGGTWIVENNYFSGMDYLNTDASATARMYYVRTIVPNTVIRHNTFYIPELTNKPANTTNTVAAIESAGSGTSIVENNIFVSVESTAQHGFFFGNTNTYKNNVFYMNANNEKAYILGTQTWSNFSAATDNIWAEVTFTDAAAGDLSLAAANEDLLVPAIADVTTDINGTIRGAETTYAGAFEFVAPAGPTKMTITPAEGTIVRGDMAPFIASVAFDVEGEYEVTWEVIDMMGNDVTEGATGLQIFYEDYDIIIRVSNDYVGNMLMVMATYGDLFAKGNYTIGEAAVVGPEGLSVYAESALEIESLGTLQLLAGFYPENATANVIWSSSDETLATVDQNGLVTSLYTATDKDTTVRIFAMAEGFEGVEGYADITLLKAESPSSLENVNVDSKATKVLRNGTLIIIRDEEEYTILGTKIQ